MHFCFWFGHDTPDKEGDELDMCSEKTCARRWFSTKDRILSCRCNTRLAQERRTLKYLICAHGRERTWKSAEISDKLRTSGPIGKFYPV